LFGEEHLKGILVSTKTRKAMQQIRRKKKEPVFIIFLAKTQNTEIGDIIVEIV
jgi:hypothetical protein